METRLFFVVDNYKTNEEIFETLQEADKYAATLANPKIKIAIVKNAYKEDNGSWNYEDSADTFGYIKNLQ